ncbi:MAG: hypothetical protein KAX49_07185 [Halanaerobiales bacterium]|nr:hypothetical protein [Halanaerobiales bacterium]
MKEKKEILDYQFWGKEIIVEIVKEIDRGKNKIIISLIFSFIFVSLLFALTICHFINQIYDYEEYPDVGNVTNNNNNNNTNIDEGGDY